MTAQAVERQLIDLKEVQDKAESEKQRWLTALLDINSKYEVFSDSQFHGVFYICEVVKIFPMGFRKADTYESMGILDPFNSQTEHFPKFNFAVQLLKHDYAILAKESHEWVNSFPAVQDMSQKVRELGMHFHFSFFLMK